MKMLAQFLRAEEGLPGFWSAVLNWNLFHHDDPGEFATAGCAIMVRFRFAL
jgi:hypothetical protein